MQKLLNRFPREQDEYIWSYYARILMANAIYPDTRLYLNYMSFKHGTYRDVQHYSLIKGWDIIGEALGLSNEQLIGLFLDAGTYNHEKHMLTDWGQITRLLYSFRPIDSNALYRQLFSNSNKYIRNIRICPECMKEDIKQNGFFYYRREHQIKGVTVCRKHGIPLMDYTGTQREAFSSGIELSSIDVTESIELQLQYANLVHKMLNGQVTNQEIADTAETMKHQCTMGSELSDTIKILRSRTLKPCISENEVKQRLTGMGLTLLSPYSEDNPVLLRHSCGHEFISSVKAVMAGFGCPVCDDQRTDLDIMTDTIKFFCGNQYVLERYETRNKVIIKDVETGEKYTTTWAWIEKFRRAGFPKSQKPRVYEPFEHSMERDLKVKACFGDDYKLVRKIDADNVQVMYIPTGESFKCAWTNVLRKTAVSPQEHQKRADEKMAERQRIVKEHFGDEYEIVEWIDNEHVTYRNNKTGETFTSQWRNVTGGTAKSPSQKTAAKEMKYKERNAAVKRCFGEDCELIKFESRAVWVKHVPSGEVFCRPFDRVLDKTARSPMQVLEEKKEFVEKVYGSDYELAEYIDCKNVVIRCKSTGEYFTRKWSAVTNRARKMGLYVV